MTYLASLARLGIVAMAAASLFCSPVSAADGNWQALFNGKDLSNWSQEGGKARYHVDNGQVVGTSVADTPNSYLVTRDRFSDFILEYEVWVSAGLNSGVQIRSNLNQDGLVTGYQVELDTTDRRFSGGIYDERRRMWMYPLTLNEKGRDAFRNGEWNRFRVEAIGDTIRVWVNGVMTADLLDDLTAEGFIGLQVHSIYEESQAGQTVRWRNLRILTEDLQAHRTPPDPEVDEVSFLVNRLSAREQREGWRLLWDGKTSQGWRGAKLDEFPSSGWTIRDGVLTVEKTDGGESTGPGDIVTVYRFSDFELKFDFRITEGANSGVKYYVDADLNQGEGSAIGCEYQVLDDARHPDAAMGVAGNRTLASLYDLVTAENLQTEGRSKQFKGIGQWNQGRIVSRGGHVEHWLNGEKYVEFDRHSQVFRALVAYSKYQVWPGFCQWPQGRILLQDHGDEVGFRNIKIREF